MTTATASHPVRVSTPVLVALVAILGIGGGLLLGYALGTGTQATPVTSSTVAADNSAVDDLLAAMEAAPQADLEAMLLPTFRFTSTNGEQPKNRAATWAMVQAWRTSMATPVRTTEVSRADDVVFVGGRYEVAYDETLGNTFTWTIRLAPDGRIASIQETLH